MAFEWFRLFSDRKSLRVTRPIGFQQSTYWLTLAWTYAIPMCISSIVIHWLASESAFAVRVQYFGSFDEPLNEYSFIGAGYRPICMLITLVLCWTTFLITLLLGFRRLPPGLLVGSNSLAISAVCHPPPEDKDAAFFPVKWGAVSHETEDGPEHCCLTSFEVEAPIEGGWYE